MIRRIWKPLIGLAVTAAFVILVAGLLDWSAVSAAISNTSVAWLAIALAALAVDFLIRIVRWAMMLRALDRAFPLHRAAGPFLGSIALNNVLPFRVGDLLRVFGFRAHLRMPPMQLAGTLVLERLLDLSVLLLFFFAGVAVTGDGTFPSSVSNAAMLVSAAVLAVLLVLFFRPSLLQTMLAGGVVLMGGEGSRIGSVVRRLGQQLVEALSLMSVSGLGWRLVLLSLMAWSLEATVFWAVASALGAHLTMLQTAFVAAAGTLATLMPSSPGYVGTFDYFALQALMACGLPVDLAGAIVLVVHAVLWLPLTIVGGIVVLRAGFTGLWKSVEGHV